MQNGQDQIKAGTEVAYRFELFKERVIDRWRVIWIAMA